MKTFQTFLVFAICIGFSSTALSNDSAEDARATKRKANSFLKFDADGDQQLDSKEYEAMIKSWFEQKGKTGYEKAAKTRFKNKDVDGNGFVSFKEQFGLDLPE